MPAFSRKPATSKKNQISAQSAGRETAYKINMASVLFKPKSRPKIACEIIIKRDFPTIVHPPHVLFIQMDLILRLAEREFVCQKKLERKFTFPSAPFPRPPLIFVVNHHVTPMIPYLYANILRSTSLNIKEGKYEHFAASNIFMLSLLCLCE